MSSVWHLVRAVLFREAQPNSDLEIGTQLSRRNWLEQREGGSEGHSEPSYKRTD